MPPTRSIKPSLIHQRQTCRLGITARYTQGPPVRVSFRWVADQLLDCQITQGYGLTPDLLENPVLTLRVRSSLLYGLRAGSPSLFSRGDVLSRDIFLISHTAVEEFITSLPNRMLMFDNVKRTLPVDYLVKLRVGADRLSL